MEPGSEGKAQGAGGRQRPRPDLLALALAAVAAPLLLALPGGDAYGEPGTASVSYGGADYTVAYDAEGVSVLSMAVEEDFASLLLGLQVDGIPRGTLEVALERSLIDARSDDGTADIEYIVVYDGAEEAAVEEIETTPESRTIRFSLPAGADEAVIFGTDLGGAGGGGGDDEAPPEEPPGDSVDGTGGGQEQTPGPEAPPPDLEEARQDPGGPAPAPFVEPGADPVGDYVKRYATEPDYAAWFDEHYAGQYASICEAVGLADGCVEEYRAAAAPEDFVDPAADPYEEYVKRYATEDGYRAWFDESYPGRQFCAAVGLEAGCVEVYEERAAAAEEAARQAAEAEAAAEEAARQAAEAEAAAEEAARQAAEAEAAEAARLAALEDTCGDGTVFRDGACVALPPSRDPVGSGRELATGVVAAFVIALAAGIIFWFIVRAGKRGRRSPPPLEPAPRPPGGSGPGSDSQAAYGGAHGGGSGGADEEPRGRGTIV